jgi:hypothetical protein
MVFQKFEFAMSARSFRAKRPGGLIIVVVPLGQIGCRSLSLIPDYSREVRLNVRLTKVKGLKHNRTSWDFEAILSISCRGAYFQTIPRFSNRIHGFGKATLIQLRLTLRESHLTDGKISTCVINLT